MSKKKEEKEIKTCYDFTVYHCELVEDKAVSCKTHISSSDDLAEAGKALGYDVFAEEHLGMFALNAKGVVVSYHEISHGDIISSFSHPRDIFKRALLCNASSIALIHNHPSSDPTPSQSDESTTKRLAECADLMGIPLIDHIIIGHGGSYCSMKAEGLLP